MKLEKLQKLQIWLVIISTVISIVCNIRNEKRQREKHERWIEECNKLDAKIHNFEPVKETPKRRENKKESRTSQSRCLRCIHSEVLVTQEPCLSCVTRKADNFEAEG